MSATPPAADADADANCDTESDAKGDTDDDTDTNADTDAEAEAEANADTPADPPSVLCLECGYNLAGHTGDAVRCPECGRDYTRAELDDAQLRAAFLPWERRGEYGLISRLVRTNLLAWFRPDRYFEHAYQRREHPIKSPVWFLFLQYAFALVLKLTTWLVMRVNLMILFWPNVTLFQEPRFELTTVVATMLRLLPAMAWLILFGSLSWCIGRSRSAGIRARGFIGLCSPLFTCASAAGLMAMLIVAIGDIVGAAQLALNCGLAVEQGLPYAFVLVASWMCSRRLLGLGVLTSLSMVLGTAAAYWFFDFYCGGLVWEVWVRRSLLS